MTVRKKLIEVSIPLEAINAASAREKSIRHGHPSTLHLWWARRPLAACRAVLFAQLVDDPSSWPDRFSTVEAQEVERKRLHDVIARMVPWEASNNETILNEARWEIARSAAWGLGEEPPTRDDPQAVLAYLQEKAPPVYDPFCGGGSIPLEAQRLGLRAYGSDLNPVAVLISKALVEIPPKFAGLPPVNPESRKSMDAKVRHWKGAEGLAADVRHYGKWMRDEAERRIGHLYPKARLPDGTEATVIVWIWARTVRSPDPAAKGAMVPLVSSFMLATKEGRKAWAEPVLDPAAANGYRFEVKSGTLTKVEEERLKKGTKSAKGQAFVCVLTGAAIDRGYIQTEGKADRLGTRLMAVVAEGIRCRRYLPPDEDHEMISMATDKNPVVADSRATFLSPPTPTRAMITGGVCSAYGLRTWGHLFSSRQLVALTTFSDLVGEARQKVLTDARTVFDTLDQAPLHANGMGAVAYADAVATYLGFLCSRGANYSSTLCVWSSHPKDELAKQVFLRQALPMTWDYAETNPFCCSGGSIENNIEWLVRSICFLSSKSNGNIINSDAAQNHFPQNIVISTDPPYFDNVGYADLSDFFYVWLRRSIVGVWPDLFRRITTPKTEELVATSFRHGGKSEAESFFMKGMVLSLNAMHNAILNDAPLAIYYAFKQSELDDDGLTSTGWASFLQSIVNTGFCIDGTWPMRTELTAALKSKTNYLASSIVLVCRKRPESAPIATRPEFLRALKRELPDALARIREAGVQAVDFQQAAIGPGMGVFSRFTKVLEADDSTMSVKTALALINGLIEELASEQDGAYDADTQAALAWFHDYGWAERASGELITLANAKATSLDGLERSGVFRTALGKARLLRREELPADWNPMTDTRFTVWEGTQHLARALLAEDGGIDAAARLHARMGPHAAEVLALVYRLFQLAERDRKDAAEALVWNRLATEWPTIERRAGEFSDEIVPEQGDETVPPQGEMYV